MMGVHLKIYNHRSLTKDKKLYKVDLRKYYNKIKEYGTEYKMKGYFTSLSTHC